MIIPENVYNSKYEGLSLNSQSMEINKNNKNHTNIIDFDSVKHIHTIL